MLGRFKTHAFGSSALAVALCTAAPAFAQQQMRDFNVPAGDLGPALNAFAQQANQEILFTSALVAGRHTTGLHGRYEPGAGIRLLLKGSGLDVASATGSVITLRSAPLGPPVEAATDRPAADPEQVAEVIVTAQKREQRLRDVPVPVAVIPAAALAANNQTLVRDYFDKVPGLSLTPGIQSLQNLAIRGITTGYANPTVGVTIDDVPYGSALGVTGGLQVPDLDPSELQRVEVLRGPQGTLYGSSSMGGLFKFVTVDPSTSKFSGSAQGSVSSVEHGDVGYGLRAAVNVPISDTIAVRVSGFARRDPGYIDNVQTGERDVNSAEYRGGRISALWRPSDNISLKLSALIQKAQGDGATESDALPGLGSYQQDRLRGTGKYDRQVQAYSGVLTDHLGNAELTSVTGYTISKVSDTFDYTPTFGPVNQKTFGVPGTAVLNNYRTRKFTEEVRASLPISSAINLLVGGFYSDERTRFGQALQAVDATSLRVVGAFLSFSRPYVLTEKAVFANATYTFTDHFDIQLGGRYSVLDQSSGPTNNFNLSGALSVSPEVSIHPNHVLTYLLTPRYKFSDNAMVYARLASGFRSGGGGTSGPADACVINHFPCQYNPDKTMNYELGIKGSTPDRVFSVDASIYYIDWKDIQVLALCTSCAVKQTFNGNGSRATSKGVEFTVEARPSTGTVISGWVAYNDARVAQDFPAVPAISALEGDRLPLSARWSANLSADQNFDLADGHSIFVGGSLSYIGSRLGVFTADRIRSVYPAYAKLDLHAGVNFEKLTAQVFINNATGTRAMLAGGIGSIPASQVIHLQPRTIGLSLTTNF